MESFEYSKTVERWGIQEISLKGTAEGNPFTERFIHGRFTSKNEDKTVHGFYDGEGVYKVRFMPSFAEEYHFTISGNFSSDRYEGAFHVEKPGTHNHGPVRVANTFHFAYEDGSPYYSIGTTCYVWELQNKELQEQTLKTLEHSAFNKIRFCIFPKHYDYNLKEPYSYPYEGTPMDSSVLTKDNFMNYNGNPDGNQWDFTQFHVEHFRHIESCIGRLCELGIEADLIVMHPYDRWGFSMMNKEQDDLYWNYVIARFSAYRNVWWSLANEYDLMPQKSMEDWERFGQILCENDSYQHLRSIHNCRPFYDYSRPWITHCSIQRQDVYKSAELVEEWRVRYRKPVVLDEIVYEGNIQHGWGNISGQELVRRFWEATCRGGYAGHGETFMNSEDILWWSHGGTLHGESPKRFEFLLTILKETPGLGLMPDQKNWDEVRASAEAAGDMMKPVKDYYLCYYGFNRPSFREFYFDDSSVFEAEVIDTWEMTIHSAGKFSGKFKVPLPGKEYMAIRLKKVLSRVDPEIHSGKQEGKQR